MKDNKPARIVLPRRPIKWSKVPKQQSHNASDNLLSCLPPISRKNQPPAVNLFFLSLPQREPEPQPEIVHVIDLTEGGAE